MLTDIREPGMYQSPVIHPSPSSYPYPPPQPAQRYYQPPPPLPPTPTAPAHAYIPRTPGMDPSLYANGPSSSPGANYSPHTPTAANRGASSSNYQLQTVVPSSSRALHQQQYMSPSLPSHFDALTTEPPALSQPSMMQSNSAPLEEATHQHVTIYEHGPSEGCQGTTLTIKCDVNFPPSSPDDTSRSPGHQASSSGRALRVVFGQHPVQTQVMVLSNQSTASNGGQMCQLNAVVPSWSSTGASAMGRQNTIPVFVQVLDGSHAIIETVTMGDFSYTNTGSRAYQYNNFNPSSVNPLKRSGEALESHRPSPNDLLHRRVLSSKSNYEHSPEIHQYPQMAPPPAYQSSPNPDGPYSSPYIPSSATMPSAPTLPSNNYPPVPHAVESGAAQPSLMRATQVVPPNINSLPMNPYVMSTSSKASLELTGDLDSMSKGWTQEEWINRRRLVQFWRRQDGTTIFAAFRPLPQQEYPSAQQSIIISCIFREDKNECFVTSVDAIYLLEALVGTRFTVEEKNRIRRNLEGFRPITVSKSKPGSEDFFKLIMGFPNPKPRNIEKDVKVFPWDILGQALKKIIGKYQSASFPYAGPGGSMASPQVTPIPYAPSIMPPPLPVQEPYSQPNSAGPAPALISHSSSDSSNYGETSSSASTYPSNALPQTPQMTQIAPIPSLPSLASQRQLDDPPHHYRSVSGPVGQQHAVTPTEKSHHANGHHSHSHSYSHTSEFVNMSPSNGEHDHNHSPYAPHHGGYWSGHGNVDPSLTQDHSIGGMNHPGEARQECTAHPGSYAMGYNGEPVHQLPHVHETHSRQPSSNDLRVVYPALA